MLPWLCLVIVGSVTASCDAGSATSSTTPASPTDLAAGFDAEVPVLEWVGYPSMGLEPDTYVDVWLDGTYSVTFGDPAIIAAPGALDDYRVEGTVSDEWLAPYLEQLGDTDLRALAADLASIECPDVFDAVAPTFMLSNRGGTERLRPCAAWSWDEYPLPLEAAARLARSAIDNHPIEVKTARRLGSVLYRIERAGWTKQALVIGTITEVDDAAPSLTFSVETTLVGTAVRTEYGIGLGQIDELVREAEWARLGELATGDSVIAFVDGNAVASAGFGDAASNIVVTELSASALNLGYEASLAARYELYRNAGVTCSASQFAIEPPADDLEPLDALIAFAQASEALALQRAWRETERKRARQNDQVQMTFSRLNPDEVVVVTDELGRYLDHVRPKDRTVITTHIRIPSSGSSLHVWAAPNMPWSGCGEVEYAPYATEKGRFVAEVPLEAIPSDRALLLGINMETGRYASGP